LNRQENLQQNSSCYCGAGSGIQTRYWEEKAVYKDMAGAEEAE
jgi:hypothetical protein